MSRKKKVIIGIIVVVVLGAAAGANVYFRREQGPSVEAEAIRDSILAMSCVPRRAVIVPS